jgi:hypothetical protein
MGADLVWSAQQQGKKVVGRMYFVHHAASERFFLHLLLIDVPGATSFEHFWTIDNTKHWDYCMTTQNGTRACGKHVSIKTQSG